MYAHIQKLIIKNRVHLQSGFISRIIQRLGINIKEKKIYIIQTILNCLSNMIFIPCCIFLIGQHVSKELLIPVLFIIVGGLSIIKGAHNYKNVFIPPFYQWYEISPVNNRKLFYTLLSVELLFSFVLNGNIAAFIIGIIVLQGFTLSSFILSINLVVYFLLLYIVSSHICARYTYNLVTKKIHIFSLLIYLFSAAIILLVMKQIISFTYHTFYLSFDFKTFDLLSDNFWLDFFNSIEMSLEMSLKRYWNTIIGMLIRTNKYINIFSFLVGCVFLVFFLLLPIKFIPLSTQRQEFGSDLLDKYVLLLRNIGKKSYIIKHLLMTMREYRWTLVKDFYQIIFLNYEAVFYIGILFPLISYVDNNMLKLHLLIVLNIQVITNQSFEIRQKLAAYFSLSNNKSELSFLKLYFEHYPIVQDKEEILRKMLIIPLIIMTVFNCLCLLFNSMTLMFLFMLILIDIIYFIVCPKIQTHMLGITANFDIIGQQFIDETFEETDLANTLQEVPRIFTNIIPIILTVPFFIFRSYGTYLLFFELLYIYCASLLVWIYCKKIEKKGIQILYDKIT